LFLSLYLFYIFYLYSIIVRIPSIELLLFIPFFIVIISLGSSYDYMPFHVFKRRVNINKSFWEDCEIDVIPEDSLEVALNNEYQSWKELGFRYGYFHQIRVINLNYLRNLSYKYDITSKVENTTDLIICAPHYKTNFFNYDLIHDVRDLMPSLASLCGNDVSSTVWDLKSDVFLPRQANAHHLTLSSTRDYERRVIRKKLFPRIYLLKRSITYDLQLFPDLVRSFWLNKGYLTSDTTPYPINNSLSILYRDSEWELDSYIFRLQQTPLVNLIKHHNYLFQDFPFMSFKTSLRSILSFILLVHHLRKVSYLTRQRVYTETENDPIFNLLSPIMSFFSQFYTIRDTSKYKFKKLNRERFNNFLRKMPSIKFVDGRKVKKPRLNYEKKNNKYAELIESSRVRLLRDIFIQWGETLNDEDFVPDGAFNPWLDVISQKRKYIEEKLQFSAGLTPVEFELEEDRNHDIFLLSNTNFTNFESFTNEYSSFCFDYEIILDREDILQNPSRDWFIGDFPLFSFLLYAFFAVSYSISLCLFLDYRK